MTIKKEIEKEKVNAVCPECLKEISYVWTCTIDSVIGTRYVFFCGECQKNLGISHEKEFYLKNNEDDNENTAGSINSPL